jgi:Domain of unknown function (DUF5076)
MKTAKELIIPETASEDPNAFELLRVWVANGGQHVSILTGIWKDPAAWGIMLADLAGHVVNAYAQEEGLDRQKTLRVIRRMFNDELDSPTDVPEGAIRRQRSPHRRH